MTKRDFEMKFLIEAINEYFGVDAAYFEVDAAELADHLLANGVIVPPCKVGDTVYMPWEWNGTKGVAILEVIRIVDDYFNKDSPYVITDLFSDDMDFLIAYNNGSFAFMDFGKIVFLTKSEAEKALAGLNKEEDNENN